LAFPSLFTYFFVNFPISTPRHPFHSPLRFPLRTQHPPHSSVCRHFVGPFFPRDRFFFAWTPFLSGILGFGICDRDFLGPGGPPCRFLPDPLPSSSLLSLPTFVGNDTAFFFSRPRRSLWCHRGFADAIRDFVRPFSEILHPFSSVVFDFPSFGPDLLRGLFISLNPFFRTRAGKLFSLSGTPTLLISPDGFFNVPVFGFLFQR